MSQSLSLESNFDSGSSQAYGDWLGVTASVACAIHCAAMPFVVGFLPLLGLSFLADPSFHKWMVGVCLALALLAFVPGWRRHRGLTPAIIGLCGLSLISIAAFAGPEDCCPSCVDTTAKSDFTVQPVGLTEESLCEVGADGASNQIAMFADGESSCAASCCSSGKAEPSGGAVAGDDDESSCAASCCSSEKTQPSGVATSGEGKEPLCDASCCSTEEAVVQADSSSYMDLMWILMTPLGGLFLVAGHLCNRFWSGPCAAGCCNTDLRDKVEA